MAQIVARVLRAADVLRAVVMATRAVPAVAHALITQAAWAPRSVPIARATRVLPLASRRNLQVLAAVRAVPTTVVAAVPAVAAIRPHVRPRLHRVAASAVVVVAAMAAVAASVEAVAQVAAADVVVADKRHAYCL